MSVIIENQNEPIKISKNETNEEEETLGDEWIYPYGANKIKTLSFVMAGGSSEWWNYLLIFNNDEDYTLYIQNKNGIKKTDSFLVMKMLNDGSQYLKEVNKWEENIYEYADDESPIIYYE
jgi:hypothetical protein